MLCSCFKEIRFFINCNRVSDPPMNDDDPVSWDGWRDFDVGDFEFESPYVLFKMGTGQTDHRGQTHP